MGAIPTLYRGIEYRSRLAARWAAFFHTLGWEHTYEPFDGDGYIPDFVIHGSAPLLVEVKPALTLDDYKAPIDKVTAGVRRQWRHDILIVGMSPMPRLPNSWAGRSSAGLLGEYWPGGDYNPDDGWDFAAGLWLSCLRCGDPGIYHDYQSYAGRPCGHHDGDHYMGYIHPDGIQREWAEACNLVKWRGTAA